MASNYCIKIRQESDNRLDQLCSWIPYDLLNIVLEFRYVSPLNSRTTLEKFNQSIIYPRDLFLCEECGPIIVLSMFANTGASLEFLQTVIHDILSFAWEIAGDPANLGRKTIKLLVQVLVQGDEVSDDSLSALSCKPASRSSIQSLKRVKLGDEGLLPFKKRVGFEGLSSKKECAICLDVLLDGDEVASMPCGHVYHTCCIHRWLKTSQLCPLCRYQISS